ncbi:MAG: prepilin-type N-terminal cleavage/methylation domain-containing protein [Aquincola tertiaricarbonis]|uniref:prepilin-type N-terminal cleavage/methylation domain-containing protein n=1 Tax=Aquincola tertiaricarbonis TaxID=391953 RepID=UPI0009F926C3|nr:prepilin-type N-terminal cleavage/methylation domain-containing protein [Aquincola tertiaricarbonis]
MMATKRRSHAPSRDRQAGVTLVEALVAFFVMALGMLAAVGTQMSLRLSNDVAKQRSEAVRLAQNDLDVARSFVTMESSAGLRSYQDIVPTAESTPLPFAGTNASYFFDRTVPLNTPFPFRAITAQVTWADRQGTTHPVRLDTIVAGIDPALSGYLSLTPDGQPSAVRSRTNSRLPPWVRDLQDGRSVFKPPGSTTVAWIFDNRSGVITSRCVVPTDRTTESLTAADLAACPIAPIAGRLVAGYVWFSLASPPNADVPSSEAFPVQPSFTFASTNTPTAECFDDSAAVRSPLRIEYYCAVFPSVVGGPWSGYLSMAPGTYWRGEAAAFQLCRYSADLDGSQSISNREHPLDYVNVTENLLNQNFLVILRSQSCPVGPGANSTAQHDPRPS